MGKLKIKFHPLFALYVFICIYFNWFNKIFYYVITVTLHEYGHYVVANHYGYEMESLVYSLSGAGITTDASFKARDEIKISLAGPIVNIFLTLIIICLWWIFPLSYLYTYDFLICNIVVLIFNILPIYPLDGGRVIVSILTIKNYNRNTVLKWNKIFCLILANILFVLFVISLFYSINFNLLITSMFLTINTITTDTNKYFDKIKTLNKKQDKPLEIKTFRVSANNKSQLLKYLSKDYISIFENNNNGKIEIIKEEDLLN